MRVVCVYFIMMVGNSVLACDRPKTLLAAEDICWTEKVQIGDKVQYATKSLLNFAKKKLGIGELEEIKPQKCEYYQCIFQQINALNPNTHYPIFDKIVDWVDGNVIYKRAKVIYDRLTICNEALVSATTEKKYFDGTLGNSTESEENTELQNTCEMLMEFMKCLSLAETGNTECPIFIFP